MSRVNERLAIENQEQNLSKLSENPYPGRGIVQGLSEDGERYVQAYWVMGRSANSRNRILVNNTGIVSTEAYDPSKVEDPSLIIYPAMMSSEGEGDHLHVVSNGKQTASVALYWNRAHSLSTIPQEFTRSLIGWSFEPDVPNYTPRITGYITLKGLSGYSIIKRDPITKEPVHIFGKYDLGKLPAGTGLCFHTYEGDSDRDPLPSFEGTPYSVPVQSTASKTAEALWENLDQRNRVAIAVKTIYRETGVVKISIINELEETA